MRWQDVSSESDFYALLSELTSGSFYYERVEPRTESGFPDIYFVARQETAGQREGTMELKHFTEKQKVDLSTAKFRGNQKAALIDYVAAGGERRFVLAFHAGAIYLWNSRNAANAVMGKECRRHEFKLEGNESELADWLRDKLR